MPRCNLAPGLGVLKMSTKRYQRRERYEVEQSK